MATRNIMIVGVGGQGTLLTSRILGGLAVGRRVTIVKLSEVHGMAQRGGKCSYFCPLRRKSRGADRGRKVRSDVLIAFERLGSV